MKTSRFQSLECTLCKAQYPVDTQTTCTKCGGVLDARYDLADKKFDLSGQVMHSIWDFQDLMPPISDGNVVSLSEGWTPIVRAERYARSIGSQDLWCKLEGLNPTGSFKDRAASLGLSLAREWQKKGVIVASTGNAAAAMSAYSARAGIPCLVLIREDSTASKLAQIAMYGAHLLRVRGIFNSKSNMVYAQGLAQNALPDWLNLLIWAPYNPLLVDGFKTMAYEIATDLGKEGIPDYIFVPTAGGDLLYGLYKGFSDLKETGTIEKIPGLVPVQGENSSPTVTALKTGAEKVKELEKAETVAGALRVSFGTDHTLHAVRKTNGFGVALGDEEILKAQREIAKLDGIFTEVSSATALAGISKAIKEGDMAKDQRALAILTGLGFKDYYPPFSDISTVPLAEELDQIPSILKSKYGF